MTPLMFASAFNHYDTVEFLFENKAKVLPKDKYKRTALIHAVKNGNLKIATLLLQKGSMYNEPDSSNNYPIHYAAAYGFPDCINILI